MGVLTELAQVELSFLLHKIQNFQSFKLNLEVQVSSGKMPTDGDGVSLQKCIPSSNPWRQNGMGYVLRKATHLL